MMCHCRELAKMTTAIFWRWNWFLGLEVILQILKTRSRHMARTNQSGVRCLRCVFCHAPNTPITFGFECMVVEERRKPWQVSSLRKGIWAVVLWDAFYALSRFRFLFVVDATTQKQCSLPSHKILWGVVDNGGYRRNGRTS